MQCAARYVDQGGNKRPGAFAIYVEPWHADILSFLNLRKNTGVVSRGKWRRLAFILDLKNPRKNAFVLVLINLHGEINLQYSHN